MMILNSLFPVFSLLLLGHLLKRWGLTTEVFLKTTDRLIYFLFFPLMLFWKIGSAPIDYGGQSGLYISALAAVGVVFVLSTTSLRFLNISRYQAGSFSQACYRFNTYVGMAIVLNALGDEGVQYFGILIGILIPFINVLIVSVLTWHSDKAFTASQRLTYTGRAMISNPLILGCLAGIIYSRTLHAFPVFLNNTFGLISMVTLPLALLSSGGALGFHSVKAHFRVSLLAAGFKLLLLPLIGYGFLKITGVGGIPFKTGMIFFCLPTSTAAYILSGQLNSDTELASASIVLSTIFSIVPLSAALLIR